MGEFMPSGERWAEAAEAELARAMTALASWKPKPRRMKDPAEEGRTDESIAGLLVSSRATGPPAWQAG